MILYRMQNGHYVNLDLMLTLEVYQPRVEKDQVRQINPPHFVHMKTALGAGINLAMFQFREMAENEREKIVDAIRNYKTNDDFYIIQSGEAEPQRIVPAGVAPIK